MPRTLRNIVEEVIGFPRTRTLWTANYYPALPITPQEFDIGALLPAMLYMARRGHRRGKGHFVEAFGKQTGDKLSSPTIADATTGLLARPESALIGFDGEVGKAVLGDLLLAWCLENRNHAEGHSEQVQRAFPTHYLASWIDLPKNVGHLRYVPELLVSLLANQDTGEWLETGNRKGRFPVGAGYANNLLLTLFGRHMAIRGPHHADYHSDAFTEEAATDIGIDELLAVRLAQACGSAPYKARGKDESERIPNRHPLAQRAAEQLREDLSVFIEVYGATVPRHGFMQMLEAGIALGLTNLLLSTASLLAVWEQTGQAPEPIHQPPWPLLVDCSHGQDKGLRDLSEASMAECIRRYERLPVLMMLLRVLDDRVSKDRKLRDRLPALVPDATVWVNLLGEIYHERHPRAEALLDALDEDCQRLAEALEKENEAVEMAQHLRQSHGSPALRLAEALCELMGNAPQRIQFLKALDSALMSDQPNGLALKRRVRRSQGGIRRAVDLRTIVLTHPLLDFLVHRHLHKAAKGKPYHPLSLQGFLKLLRERYGLYVDKEPPGQPIPQEMLLRNKAWLERRLRDLGLLVGVNDAESMKQLKPRYQGEVYDD